MDLLSGAKNVHIIGAGGIGLSAAAKLLLHRGLRVGGSDMERNEAVGELARLGLQATIGHRAENLGPTVEAVIYSDAVPEQNPERREAERRGLPQYSYFDFLGQLSRAYRTVAVSGTNGKSSTTALLGMAMIESGLDPTVIVGSRVDGFPDQNLRLGQSDLLVVEACEYRANMLKLRPQMIVLTNLEADHLDYYRDLNHIKQTFQQYLDSLPPDGQLITNADDPDLASLKPPVKPVTYGFGQSADYRAVNWQAGPGRQEFRLQGPEKDDLGAFTSSQPGQFNVMNALAAIAAALRCGADLEAVRRAVEEFPGIWRRFQRLGRTASGALVISDYGHTPVAVRETLRAARQFYPNSRLTLCFQPHHRNRTKQRFDDFVAAFDEADRLLLVEIYDVAGREAAADADISSRDLVRAVQDRDRTNGRQRTVSYSAAPEQAGSLLAEPTEAGEVILVMGAGNIYRQAEKIAVNPI